MNRLARHKLSDVAAEHQLVGSFLAYPDGFKVVGEQINPDWFTDPVAQAMWDAAWRVHQSGERVSMTAVVAQLPADIDVNGDQARRKLFVALFDQAVPQADVGGIAAVVRDRWARRLIKSVSDMAAKDADLVLVTPQSLIAELTAPLDRVSAAFAARGFSGTMADAVAALHERLSRSGPVEIITTGLKSVDERIGGYGRGRLVVIGARPGMGKSALMCSSGRMTAEAGHGVQMFSLEMEREEIVARMAADAIGHLAAPFGAMLRQRMSSDQRQDLDQMLPGLEGLPMLIDATPRLTFAEIAARSRKAKALFEARGQRLDVIFIDHFGLITPSERYAGNKVAEAGEISGLSKALAKELDCCVVLLCQLNREVEKDGDKRPTLAHLRWSGDIEQDADVVAFLYREAYYLKNDPKADPNHLASVMNNLEFLVRKNRQGETGDIELRCAMPRSAIWDSAA